MNVASSACLKLAPYRAGDAASFDSGSRVAAYDGCFFIVTLNIVVQPSLTCISLHAS